MSPTILKEVLFPQSVEQVWQALATSSGLAEWMYPNDFEPCVGHQFTFRVPPRPEINFDGLSVRCEVLECEPPSHLAFSWSAGGPVENTRVTFRLEPQGNGSRLLFEHTGFDLTHPFGKQAFAGADYGWSALLGRLPAVAAVVGGTIRVSRVLPASARQIFAAFENPDIYARWWGPKDFTNTFEHFDFQPGGRWVYVMHGPNGADYPNESVFREIEPDTRIVIEHVVLPHYRLVIRLTSRGETTHLAWAQTFENTTFVARMRDFLTTANEQNLDRLEAVLTAP